MANEKNLNNNETTEYEIKKSLLDSFVDLFKRPAALPGEIPSKHKTTNIDMRTSMTFREFRASIMKSVGNFFHTISNLGSPKKEETLNKYTKEYINNTQTEVTKTTDEISQTQQHIHIPGPVSITHARKTPIVETISVNETFLEVLQNETAKTTLDSDLFSDTTHADNDFVKQSNQTQKMQKPSIKTETLVTGNLEKTNDSKTKPTADDKEKHDLDL